MKLAKRLAILAVLLVGAGCRSTHPDSGSKLESAAAAPSSGMASDVTYTVEMIPNPRLSATSREGDSGAEVYSSNIVAVHVHHNGVGTNSLAGAQK